jgi:hypothetical protein
MVRKVDRQARLKWRTPSLRIGEGNGRRRREGEKRGERKKEGGERAGNREWGEKGGEREAS